MTDHVSLEFIVKLREAGVRRAKFDAGAVTEVEFFGADAPPMGVSDGAIEAAANSARESDGTEGYEQALSQIQRKRFGKQGEA